MSHLQMTVAELHKAAEDAAAELLGTCRDLQDLNLDAANSSTFCAHLDSLALQCVNCSWWVTPEEMTDAAGGEFVCFDCNMSEAS